MARVRDTQTLALTWLIARSFAHTQRLHVDIDLHDMQSERLLHRIFDDDHDIVSHFDDPQTVFENDPDLDDHVICDEAYLDTARAPVWRAPLDVAQTWAPPRDAHHAVALGGSLGRNRRNGPR